jgi:thioester reductase-like protein
MSENRHDVIDDFYEGRHVFFTGATGMLGTACLSRLVLETSVACVYAAVRGGER